MELMWPLTPPDIIQHRSKSTILGSFDEYWIRVRRNVGMASLFKDWSGAVTDKREAGPINGECLIAEFFQKAEFGLAEGGPFISPFDEMLVHGFHKDAGALSSARVTDLR